MRYAMLLGLLTLGCSEQQVPTNKPVSNAPVAQTSTSTQKDVPPAKPLEVKTTGQGEKVPPLPAANPGGSDWPQFLGPFGTSVSAEKGIISPWPKEGLRLIWQQKTGSGYAPPVISRGRLFLFDRHGDQARLTCMHPETAAFLWKFEYPTTYQDKYGYNNGPRCCPIVDQDRVYLHGVEGMLHCLRADNGKVVWKVDTRQVFGVVQNFFGVGSTPIVEGDVLIVQVGGSPMGSNPRDFENLKGDKSGVVAFNKYNGEVKYRITDELASYSCPVLATVNGRRWGFVLARSGLIGFEPGKGTVDFHFPWRAEDQESVNASNPVVVGSQVFISETYGPGSALLKVKPGGYEEVWTDAKKRENAKSMQCHWMTPIHHAGYLYGCSGRRERNAELRCIELATGKVMWSEGGLGRTSLLMVDGHFICQSEFGPLVLLKVNPQKYDEVSVLVVREPGQKESLLEYPCWAAPILSHDLLYIRSEERLVCLELIGRKKE